jgi:hypothetical protein
MSHSPTNIQHLFGREAPLTEKEFHEQRWAYATRIDNMDKNLLESEVLKWKIMDMVSWNKPPEEENK